MKKRIIVFIGLAILIAAPTYAIPYGFESITNTIAGDAAIGEAQLFVDVTDPGLNQVLFTFSNTGPAASSITDVYFDDGSLFDFDDLIDADQNGGHPGVDFSPYATPSNLPSANNASPSFVTYPGMSYDADDPVQHNGVNPGEYLGILFDLTGGNVFDNVVAAINSGDLRIGIHVQGHDGGGSESFVNRPNPVPEPATMVLLGIGLVGLAGFGRKKFLKKE